MKIQLTFANLGDPVFTAAFAHLCNQPFTGDEFAHLCTALDRIEAKHTHYRKGLLNLFKKYGRQDGEHWRLDSTDAKVLQMFGTDRAALEKCGFTIALIRKIPWPKEVPISPAQYRALRDAGILESISAPEPTGIPEGVESGSEEKETSPVDHPAAPAERPPIHRNGEPGLEPAILRKKK